MNKSKRAQINEIVQGCANFIVTHELDVSDFIQELKAEVVIHVLKKTEGNRAHAAMILNLQRPTFNAQIKKLVEDGYIAEGSVPSYWEEHKKNYSKSKYPQVNQKRIWKGIKKKEDE